MDFNLNLISIDYYFIDKKAFKLFAGGGFDIGYNFGSLDNGFNLGFPLEAGMDIGPVNIKGIFRPGFFTDQNPFWRIQVSYIFNPTNFFLKSNQNLYK